MDGVFSLERQNTPILFPENPHPDAFDTAIS